MSLYHSPQISLNGLVLCLDAANTKSYPDSETTWTDLSGNANNGTLVNGVGYNGSNLGSLVFDGVDDTATFPFVLNYLPALSNFSIEIWVRLSSYPTALATPNTHGNTQRAGVLIGATHYAGVALYWTGNTTGTSINIRAFIRGADAYRSTSSYTPSLNTWTQLVLVNNYSTSKLQYYVNGSLYNEVTGPTQEYNASLTPTAGNIGICRSQVNAGGTLNYSLLSCNVGSAKIYKNKALTASEIQQNFNALKSRFIT